MDNLLVGLIVLVAAFAVGRRLFLKFRSPSKYSCNSGCATCRCSEKPQETNNEPNGGD